jgi:hypothetical protein
MKCLARFFATTLLVISITAVALGGETQGPNKPPPPPPAESTTAVQSLSGDASEQVPSLDLATELTVLISVVARSIF